MPDAIYHVVEHDGGWAYKLGDVFSETYPTREAAHRAAEAAAGEQHLGGENAEIQYQDATGRWRQEHSDGGDRPDATVED